MVVYRGMFGFKRKENYLFDYFEIHLAEHCNLNCQSCSNFSSLAEEEYITPEEFEKQFKRFSEITKTKVQTISLLGGEPLLNPNCTEILFIARKYFPNTCIQLVTNGILLTAQKAEFWEALRDNNIVLRPTKYPININWDEIFELVQKYGVNFKYYNDVSVEKKTNMFNISIEGKLNIKENHKKCILKGCVILFNGKLYPCSIPSNIRHFNKYFNLHIPEDEKNGIDIFKEKNINKIKKFLSKPIPMCQYCEGSNVWRLKEWKLGERKISEWIIKQKSSKK